jgi:hypothetical protein
VSTSPLSEVLSGRPRRAAGSEALVFTNGSALRPHPPTRDGLHGEQSDHNDVDEAWAYDEVQGDGVLQAIEPTQATRPGAQTWIWSTRGDRNSTWFHGLINRAYSGEPGFALFDFGIPDDLEPTDENMAAYHPALGHTIDLETISRSTLPPGERARAYGNRATGAGERVIPLEAWLKARTEEVLPAGRPAYGVGVAADGSAGALAAAVLGEDGVPWVEIIEHRPGRSWLVDRVQALRDKGEGVVGDRLGPAAPVVDQLELAGVELIPLGGGDYPAACQDLYDRVTDPAGPRLRHRMHGALDDAADIAGKRLRGDGAWVWSRTRSAGDISALEAATLAAWAVLRNPGGAGPVVLLRLTVTLRVSRETPRKGESHLYLMNALAENERMRYPATTYVKEPSQHWRVGDRRRGRDYRPATCADGRARRVTYRDEVRRMEALPA